MASLIAFMPCLMILSEAAECMFGNGKGVTVCSGTQVCAVCGELVYGCSSCLGHRAGGVRVLVKNRGLFSLHGCEMVLMYWKLEGSRRIRNKGRWWKKHEGGVHRLYVSVLCSIYVCVQ